MTHHNVPEDIIAALQALEATAKKNTSLASLKDVSGKLVKMFHNASRTNQNRKYLQDLRKEISGLNLLINTAVTTGRFNAAVADQVHPVQQALLDLVDEMAAEEEETRKSRAFPLQIAYNPSLSPNPDCMFTQVLYSLKTAHAALERLVHPEKFKVNGKFAFRAVGAVINADGDIGSGNRGPALHDYTAGHLTARGSAGIGSGNDTSGTEGNVNLARGAHIFATEGIMSGNKGDLGDLDFTAARIHGKNIGGRNDNFADNAVSEQGNDARSNATPPPYSKASVTDVTVVATDSFGNKAVVAVAQGCEEITIKPESTPAPVSRRWFNWLF
jgi:hypothetical protein